MTLHLSFALNKEMKPKLSAKAVTERLKQVSDLRELCLSLGKAGESIRVANSKPSSKIKPRKNKQK